MDPTACNYDAGATEDDGSCEYFSCAFLGCTDATACNFNPFAFFEDGSCEYPESGLDCAGQCADDADGDGVCDADEVVGCQVAGACNFDPAATEAGGCSFPAVGYNCAGGCLADADGDGVCDAEEVVGCQVDGACNFNPVATDAGGCEFPQAGYDCAGGCLQDADGDGVCDGDEVAGCTDAGATNYAPEATDDDGSCFFGYPVPADWQFTPTPWSAVVLGQARLNGLPVSAGDVVAAFTPQGLCVGTAICIEVGGLAYFILPIYGDDATTSPVEGMWPGATFSLRLWDAASGASYTFYNAQGAAQLPGWQNTQGAPLPGYTDPTAIFDFLTNPVVSLCGDAAACNYTGVGDGFAGCFYPATGYDCAGQCIAPDACGVCNGPGAIYACGCSEIPVGDCDCDGAQVDAVGVCGGDCAADADADGLCDTVDACVGALDACGVCNGPGAIYACGCSEIPAGACNCAGDVQDALGVCGGDCGADIDADGICDTVDACVGALDACGVCNGPGAVYACGCSGIPAGACNCAGDVQDALGVCGGDCAADADADGICDALETAGCTDSSACNFDPLATLNDSSCTYAALWLTCDGGCLVDTDGDGICEQDEVHGCMDAAACNFLPAATEPGDCFFPPAGLDCAGACLADSDGDGVCDADERPGCTQPSSLLYNPYATDSDPSACTVTCPDLSGDGVVGTADLLMVLAYYGNPCE